jgi:hypothetical protein
MRRSNRMKRILRDVHDRIDAELHTVGLQRFGAAIAHRMELIEVLPPVSTTIRERYGGYAWRYWTASRPSTSSFNPGWMRTAGVICRLPRISTISASRDRSTHHRQPRKQS